MFERSKELEGKGLDDVLVVVRKSPEMRRISC